jgi:hypothetical protein
MRPTIPTDEARRLTPARIDAVIARAARRGATPAELGHLARCLAAELRDQPRAKRAKRDQGASGTAGQVERSARALLRRLDDEPEGVGAAAARIIRAGEAVRDEAVRELRARRTFSWAAIAGAVEVPLRTAIRRWGPEGANYPGGLPEGGQQAGQR